MKTRVHALTLAISLSWTTSLWALEAMTDEGMSEVSGQAGVDVFITDNSLDIARYAFQDESGGLDLRLNQINITPLNVALSYDVGADASNNPGLKMAAVIQPFQLKSGSLQINDPASGSTNTFGLFAAETLNTSTLSFSNVGGLLNNGGNSGNLSFDARGANWYLAQPRSLAAGGGNGDPTQGYNVLVFRNFNARGSATGKFGADATKGLNFMGTVSLPRIDATNSGLQMDLGFKNNVNFSNTSNFDFSVVSAATTQSYWRFGFSGDLMNVDYSIIGGPGTGIGTGLGSMGVILRPKFDFARSTDADPFVLELGEPGGSAIRFGDWVALGDGAAASPSRSSYDLGTLYFNLLPPVSGNGLANFTTPATNSFTSAFGGINTVTTANQNAGTLAVRGFELQGYARGLTFHDTASGAQLGAAQTWALIPTFYNLDGNLLTYASGHPNASTRHGMGLDMTVQTTGKNTAYGTPSTKGSHLVVADTTAQKYMGFRNIDSRYAFLNGQLYMADPSFDFASGSGLDVTGLRLSSQNMSFDIRADFAMGDLPDGTAARQIRDDDGIFGMRWKFGGDFSFTLSPPPAGQSYIGISSHLNATDASKNGIYITEPVDGTRIEWINITGKLNLLSQHVMDGDYSDASRIDILREATASYPGPTQRNLVTFATAYEMAPGTAKTDVISIGQLNLYRPPASNAAFHGATSGGSCSVATPCYREGVDWKPGFDLSGTTAGTGTAYTLGEMVIPGGRFYGQIDLRVK